MNENNHLPTDLPTMHQDFVLDKSGKITKHRWVGEFTCKIPNTKEKCLIAKHRAYLDGQFADFLDPATIMIHKKVAYLRFTLTDFPKWWRDNDLGYELMDHNIIEDVYDEVLKFEKVWLKEVWGDDYTDEDGLEGSEDGKDSEKELKKDTRSV